MVVPMLSLSSSRTVCVCARIVSVRNVSMHCIRMSKFSMQEMYSMFVSLGREIPLETRCSKASWGKQKAFLQLCAQGKGGGFLRTA